MFYNFLMYGHLATVIPCFFIGAYLLAVKKGTSFHKNLGKIYMILLYFGAIIIAGGFTFTPGRFLHTYFFGS